PDCETLKILFKIKQEPKPKPPFGRGPRWPCHLIGSRARVPRSELTRCQGSSRQIISSCSFRHLYSQTTGACCALLSSPFLWSWEAGRMYQPNVYDTEYRRSEGPFY